MASGCVPRLVWPDWAGHFSPDGAMHDNMGWNWVPIEICFDGGSQAPEWFGGLC